MISDMPFGWFSGSSTPKSSQTTDASRTAKSIVNSPPSLRLDPQNPDGIKPCCACPITKQKRDDCFMNSANGEVECKDLIQAHKEYEWLLDSS